jgi:RecJ-like exonuclease
MSVTASLSHKEDVDGILSAVLIKAAFNADTIVLTDYQNVISNLDRFTSAELLPKLNRIFISDLGLSKKNEDEFLEIIGKITSSNIKVAYIDHHDLSGDTAFTLKKMGVLLIHSVEECSSVQIYQKFKKKLRPHAAFFAAAGSLTDYMDSKPVASNLVSRYDRQFLMLESTVLSYMISAKQNDDEFLVDLVNHLSGMKYPHDIQGGFSIAEKYAQKVSEAIKKIEGSIERSKNIAYVQNTLALSTSGIVNFVLGTSNRPVAIVYKLKVEADSYVLSIRGNKSCKLHLGRAVNQLSSELGGSGGGHDLACGAIVPKDKLYEFICLLDNILTKI